MLGEDPGRTREHRPGRGGSVIRCATCRREMPGADTSRHVGRLRSGNPVCARCLTGGRGRVMADDPRFTAWSPRARTRSDIACEVRELLEQAARAATSGAALEARSSTMDFECERFVMDMAARVWAGGASRHGTFTYQGQDVSHEVEALLVARGMAC